MKGSSPSEFRQDPLFGNWVIIATKRAHSPRSLAERERTRPPSKKNCPFCDLSTQEPAVLQVGDVVSIPNKYPALVPSTKSETIRDSVFVRKLERGYHEVVVLPSHTKSLALLSPETLQNLVRLFVLRHNSLFEDKKIKQVMIFHNWKEKAGATVFHPHCQIIASPVVGTTFSSAKMTRLRNLYHKWKKCPFCYLQSQELRKKTRILYQNKEFVVISPFAPRSSFELIISSKTHLSSFFDFKEKHIQALAQALGLALYKIHKGLGDPALNFYIHTAPRGYFSSPYFHWHLTILPRLRIPAGFEAGANIFISTILPEKVVEYLKKVR